MNVSLVNIMQINLHQSESAFLVLTSCMTVWHTCQAVVLVQELWLVRNRIRGLIEPVITYMSGA